MLNFLSLPAISEITMTLPEHVRERRRLFSRRMWQVGEEGGYNVRASLPSSFARPLPCSQTRSPIRKSTLAICWNTYERIYTTIMPLKHAESRAIQPLFHRYRVWRCSPLFPSVVVVVGESGRQ